jgi:tRNA dimethylallyltransferase
MAANRVLILGVTASGKGRLAFELARSLDAEIISVDSMKVYRRMNIGTAKPPKEALQQVKHHLVDVVEPSESFSVGAFLKHAQKAMQQITSRRKNIVAVGGTALYIKALLYGLFEGPGVDEWLRDELRARAEAEGLVDLHRELALIDPVAAERISPNDAKRIIRAIEVYKVTGRPISSFQKQWDRRNTQHDWMIIGIRRERAEENRRINARVKRMVSAGLVDEVKSLLAEDKPLSKQANIAIGYAEIIKHLAGQMTLEEAVELIKRNTRRLAKSQRTWFKTFRNVNWFDTTSVDLKNNILDRIKKIINY